MRDYTVWRLDPDPCDYPDCPEVARLEVGIEGSPVSHRYTCDQHTRWAGADALRRHAERAARFDANTEQALRRPARPARDGGTEGA